MTRSTAVVVLAGAVTALVAGAAAGKAPPEGILICGPDLCKAIRQSDAERFVISLYGSDSQPPEPGPSFLLRWRWNAPEQRVWWVPSGGFIRGLDGRWTSLSVASEALLESWTAGLKPFPAPTLTRVVVGGRVAENPQSYLRLLRGGALAPSFDGARGFVDVRLTSLEASPWTDGGTWLRVSKASSFVWRDVWIYRVAPTLAERARQARSLAPFVRTG